MPIQLVCSCGKRLQVGDQYAGRKVSCPGCKAILTAPGTPAAPAASPPPPPPAPPKPAPPAAAKPAALPLPPPPAKKPAKDEVPFTLDPPGVKDEDEDEPRPTAKKAAAKSAPPAKRGRRDDDDDDDDRPRRSTRTREEESEKTGASAWKSFAGGSALAWWGLWIEFLSLAYGLGMTAYMISGLIEDTVATARKINDAGGPTMFIPFFVGTAIGSLLTLLGRTRMISIPPGTGAKKVFFGSWALTVIRFLAVVASAGLILMAGSEWPDLSKPGAEADGKAKDAILHMFLAFIAFSVSTPFWILADLSTIPAMAIVGGVIPSAKLRQKAGQVTFILQLLVLAYVLAVIFAVSGLSQVDWKSIRDGTPEEVTTTTRTTTTAGRATTTTTTASSGAKAAIMVSAGLGILVQFAYTALFGSMYGAGRRAVAEAREDEQRAEDEEI